MTVQAMPAPRPALRYLLLPDLREQTAGNPIPAYLACIMEREQATDQTSLSRSALKKADLAARMDKPDWQILQKARTDGFYLLLPDVQKMRELAANLKERFLVEVSEHRFDDAIVTAKTMFALARHMGEHPTLIGDLVAIAIAQVAIGPFEEMLNQPGCPNFYWALTNLPDPFISIDHGLEGERLFFDTELRDLSETTPMSKAQLKKFAAHLDEILSFTEKEKLRTQRWLDLQLSSPVSLSSARERLVAAGLPEERLSRFPPEQILLLDEKYRCVEGRDDILKGMKLPTWQVLEQFHQLSQTDQSQQLGLLKGLLPSLEKVRLAQGRLEQRFALLRHVEAIRMYAADHGGRLPEKLTEITVPLPVDPFTGKPFRYSLEGDTAHLRGAAPAGYANLAAYNLHYVITIRKP